MVLIETQGMQPNTTLLSFVLFGLGFDSAPIQFFPGIFMGLLAFVALPKYNSKFDEYLTSFWKY